MLCRLPKDVGFPCGRVTPYSAYYFDVDEGKCLSFLFQVSYSKKYMVSFEFKGCGGNQNRFLNKQECQDGCGALSKFVRFSEFVVDCFSTLWQGPSINGFCWKSKAM